MDISKGNLECSVQADGQHNTITEMIKVGSAGFQLLERVVTGESGDHLLGSLVMTADKRWGKGRTVPRPVEKTRNAAASFANFSIVLSIGALEFFLNDLIRDVLRFCPTLRFPNEPSLKHDHSKHYSKDEFHGYDCCDGAANNFSRSVRMWEKIPRIQSVLGLSLGKVNDVKSLFDYFRLARNCIVHESARASKDLADHSWSTALNKWDQSHRGQTPPPQQFSMGATVSFLPYEAILCAAVCRYIAMEFTKEAVLLLGDVGMIEMASFYTLFLTPPAANRHIPKKAKLPENVIKQSLIGRYRVRKINDSEIIDALRERGAWKAVRRSFEQRYSNSTK